MKKKSFLIFIFFIFLIYASLVSSEYWNELTIGQGDSRYCRLFNSCTVKDLNVTGNFTGNQFYGETNIHPDGNITVIINTQDVHENITGFNETTSNGFTLQGDNSLVVDVAGRYQADFWVSSSGGVNRVYETCLAINNEHATPHAHRRQGTPGDIGSMSGGGIIDLEVGDYVNLQVRNVDGTQNVDIFYAGMRLERIGE